MTRPTALTLAKSNSQATDERRERVLIAMVMGPAN